MSVLCARRRELSPYRRVLQVLSSKSAGWWLGRPGFVRSVSQRWRLCAQSSLSGPPSGCRSRVLRYERFQDGQCCSSLAEAEGANPRNPVEGQGPQCGPTATATAGTRAELHHQFQEGQLRYWCKRSTRCKYSTSMTGHAHHWRPIQANFTSPTIHFPPSTPFMDALQASFEKVKEVWSEQTQKTGMSDYEM